MLEDTNDYLCSTIAEFATSTTSLTAFWPIEDDFSTSPSSILFDQSRFANSVFAKDIFCFKSAILGCKSKNPKVFREKP